MRTPSNQTADVLIVGAGAAGLSCAAEIVRRSKRSVLILEARDRIGGRCDTRMQPGLAAPMEFGAEFIHGRSRPVLSLLKKAGGTALDSAKTHWFGDHGKLSARADLLPEIRRAMGKPHSLQQRDVSFEEYLTRTLITNLSPAAVAYARSLVAGYDAADPARISALEIVDEWTGGGGADGPVSRPSGGYRPLLEFLARTLVAPQGRVQLETQIETVKWKRGKVEVSGLYRGKPLRATAPQAVITLPVGVMQLPTCAAGAVRFQPALAQKNAALRKMDAGSVVKVALRFRSAFWEKLDGGRYRDAAFLHSNHAAFPTFWTALPLRSPLLVAWSGGPRARRLATYTPGKIIRLALDSLESIFDKRAAVRKQFLGSAMHDWLHDPYCHGTYSSLTVGGRGAREILARPLRGTLFFAGEATDLSGEAATVGGALQSGTRAARELLNKS